MTVRHVVDRANVGTDGYVLDPRRVRHGALRAGRVHALAGEIDPSTHLNLDFADHRLDACVVVERLEPGAAVISTPPELGAPHGIEKPQWIDAPAVSLARVGPGAYDRLGLVDVGARRAAWLTAVRTRRDSK
ncbi:MAG: hypothetical protein M3442_08825 [Chloroflexota bacterium]|nr:hypothetical protein [Chloroflexota bacterium]